VLRGEPLQLAGGVHRVQATEGDELDGHGSLSRGGKCRMVSLPDDARKRSGDARMPGRVTDVAQLPATNDRDPRHER
jgi:hypothetical protein